MTSTARDCGSTSRAPVWSRTGAPGGSAQRCCSSTAARAGTDDQLLAGVPKNQALNPYGMELIGRVDILAALNRVETPTLVSVGDLDPVTPVGAAGEIVAALPDGFGRLVVLAGAGHFPWLDDSGPLLADSDRVHRIEPADRGWWVRLTYRG